MRHLKLLLFILLFCFSLFSCQGGPSDDPTTTGPDTTEDSSTDTSTDTSNDPIGDNPSTIYAVGYGEDGPCLQGGIVEIFPLISQNLAQIGTYDKFQTTTINDFGKYEIPIELDTDTYPCAEVFITAQCHNEITGGIMDSKVLNGIVCWDSGESNNINPLTTIRTPIIRHLYNTVSSSTYQNADESIDEAERLIIAYFNMPALIIRFTNMTLQDSTEADAVLVAANSALLNEKTEGEQNDFMSRISQDIIAGTTNHRNELLASLQNLPIPQIKANLESRYLSLGHILDTPPFWNIIDSNGDGIRNEDDSDSNIELFGRVPIVQYAINDNLSGGGFDTNDNKYFAFPLKFITSGSARFVITNVSGDHISFHNNDDSGAYDLPGTEIVTAEKMPHDYFDTTLKDENDVSYSVPNTFSAKIDFDWVQDVKYWAVVRCNDFCRPSMGSPSGTTPFGKNLHSVDGVTWVGFDQSANFFRGNKFEGIFTN